MNLFLVTSPFQLICAIEAKKHYGAKENILLLREEKMPSAKAQMRLLLNKEEWEYIIFLGRRSKVWEARKLQYRLKKINPSLKFESIFYADYSAWRTAVLLNNITTEREVMIDDGVGTIREYREKIQPELHVSRNKSSRDKLLKLVGLKPPRLIYPRRGFSFFTFFELSDSRFPIEENQLSVLKQRLNTMQCFSDNAPAGFIGQGMVAEKGISLDSYCHLIGKLLEKHPQGVMYFPHRTEADFVRQRLQTMTGLIYHQSKLPLELELAVERIQLSAIYGIASTAEVTLEKIYPEIPVFDIEIPTKYYLIEEFGQNFIDVAKELSLKKSEITLES